MKRPHLTQEKRALTAEIQELLLDCFFEHREAIANGDKHRARQLEEEIENLKHEKKSVEEMVYSRVHRAY